MLAGSLVPRLGPAAGAAGRSSASASARRSRSSASRTGSTPWRRSARPRRAGARRVASAAPAAHRMVDRAVAAGRGGAAHRAAAVRRGGGRRMAGVGRSAPAEGDAARRPDGGGPARRRGRCARRGRWARARAGDRAAGPPSVDAVGAARLPGGVRSKVAPRADDPHRRVHRRGRQPGTRGRPRASARRPRRLRRPGGGAVPPPARGRDHRADRRPRRGARVQSLPRSFVRDPYMSLHGLLPVAPLLVLAPYAVPPTWRRRQQTQLAILVTAVALYAAECA